ncbi:hypothetical protein UFOVP28_17 [uncultured Caudovirales phage]|uniref:Uncharacterized protein n=1 Tax=uncultured Caudovirales phage TaxID=2100421 RepID=A0A6J5KK61_9CAUD|nr:hypothetical protein UFOVP28_17 [uncultured Caudovirales phage]
MANSKKSAVDKNRALQQYRVRKLLREAQTAKSEEARIARIRDVARVVAVRRHDPAAEIKFYKQP